MYVIHLYKAAVQGVDEAVEHELLRQGARRVPRPRHHAVQLPVHVVLGNNILIIIIIMLSWGTISL